jgi:radical SAM superfamily enzyme YgiQ (UPF0313 family)
VRALLLHPHRALRDRNEIMVMPLGLLSIAAHLAARGVDAAIHHLGIERQLVPRYDVAAAVAESDPAVVFVVLHWHPQVRPALQLAQLLERRLPQVPIALGGYTASYFARELLAEFPEVDYVVRGDGEEPAAALCAAIGAGATPAALGAVPNLAWRDAGEVRLNDLSWRVDEANAPALRHAAFEHLRHAEEYLARDLYADFNDAASAARLAGAFYYNPGRGCPVSCSYCGGGALPQLAIAGRRGFLFYPREKVARDLDEAWAAGARTWRASFDPAPGGGAWPAILAEEQRRGHRWRLVYDCWPLPSDELIGAIAGATAEAVLVLSPECGDDELRRRHRGFHFSNAELLDAVARMRRAGLEAHAFLSVGLPGETRAMVEQTAALARRLRDAGAGVSVCPMILDPGSPMFEHPDRFRIKPRVRRLRDYYRLHPDDPGPYYRTEPLSEADIRSAVDRIHREVRR